MTERTPEEIEAAAVEINFCFQKIGCRRDVAEKYWRHLPETSWEKTSTREIAARILAAAADAVREKADAARRGMVEGGGR